MTARPTADDIIPAPETRTRGAFSESVPAAEFRAALTGLTTAVSISLPMAWQVLQAALHSTANVLATAQGAPAEPLVHHRQQYATTRAL